MVAAIQSEGLNQQSCVQVRNDCLRKIFYRWFPGLSKEKRANATQGSCVETQPLD